VETIIFVLLAIILLAFLMVLTCFAFIMYILMKRLLKEEGVDLSLPFLPSLGQDSYTPSDAAGQSVGLENFRPDPKRPLKVVVKDEEDQITPIK
jgi:hypothetical protein